MEKPVHKSTITLTLEVQDGTYEESFALSNDSPAAAWTALKHLLCLTSKRKDCLIRGFAWRLKSPSEIDQFSQIGGSK